MDTQSIAMSSGKAAPHRGIRPRPEVVEISLALPTSRMEALVALSMRRSQTVGQLLRHLINQALDDVE